MEEYNLNKYYDSLVTKKNICGETITLIRNHKKLI